MFATRGALSFALLWLLFLLCSSGTRSSLPGGRDGQRCKFDKGIAYAAPPVGDLRWRLPQAAKAWQGVLAADKFGPACLQADNVPKSEDCQTLNVWRPAADAEKARPVMVWIHGGAMVHGSSAIYPLDALAAKGVVLACIVQRGDVSASVGGAFW